MASVNQIIKQAEKLAAAATPGPWSYESQAPADGNGCHHCLISPPDDQGDDYAFGDIESERDAAYIAHIHPSNMRRLIAAFNEMRDLLTWQGVFDRQEFEERRRALLAKLDADE